MGSFGTDDGESNGNDNQNNFASALRNAFLYISLPLLYDYDEKLPKFHVLCRTWTQDHDVLILFLNLDSPSEFNSGKNCQHLMNWTRWNKPDKVWNSANSRLSDVLVSVAVVVA